MGEVGVRTPALTITLGQQLLPFGLEAAATEELKPVIRNALFTNPSYAPGAKAAGAHPIVVVDRLAEKESLARQCGDLHAIGCFFQHAEAIARHSVPLQCGQAREQQCQFRVVEVIGCGGGGSIGRAGFGLIHESPWCFDR